MFGQHSRRGSRTSTEHMTDSLADAIRIEVLSTWTKESLKGCFQRSNPASGITLFYFDLRHHERLVFLGYESI
jgi:hypothetical protein